MIEVTLEEVLMAKEERVLRHEQFARIYGGTLVSFNLNIPGPIKTSEEAVKIFTAGLEAWRERNPFQLLVETTLTPKTGPEYLAVVNGTPLLVKALTTDIEESHELGRLFDFDVLDANLQSYSRSQLGKGPRTCLICHSDAFECGRGRTHKLNELLSRINQMATNYFEKGSANH